MDYFNVTIMEKGKKRLELIKSTNKMAAIQSAKQKYPSAMVMKAEQTAAPIEETIKELFAGMRKSAKKSIPINDKISTIRQIAVMTDAGIPINDTLKDVADNTQSQALKDIYISMNNDINAGSSMSDSMAKFKEEFGHVALAMTDLGERTGNISQSYHKLADILENIRDNSAKFKKAMAIAFTILIMVVVPKFKDIFEQLHTELPVPTLILLFLEHAFNTYGLYILAGLIGLIFFVKFMYRNSTDFQRKVDIILIHPRFYLINKAIFLSTMHQYNLVFGELVKAGIPVNESLETAVGMVHNLAIKDQLMSVNANIGRGMSLAEAFDQTGLYENMLLQMIKAGEAGGQLDAMLQKVTDYYDMRFQDLIDNLSAYIEPVMMFFIAGLVLLMALGIFMPMWDLGKAAKG